MKGISIEKGEDPRMTLETQVLAWAAQQLELSGEERAAVNIQTDLRPYGLDSIAFVSLIVTIENELGGEFPPENLVLEELASVEAICAAARAAGLDLPAQELQSA